LLRFVGWREIMLPAPLPTPWGTYSMDPQGAWGRTGLNAGRLVIIIF